MVFNLRSRQVQDWLCRLDCVLLDYARDVEETSRVYSAVGALTEDNFEVDCQALGFQVLYTLFCKIVFQDSGLVFWFQRWLGLRVGYLCQELLSCDAYEVWWWHVSGAFRLDAFADAFLGDVRDLEE